MARYVARALAEKLSDGFHESIGCFQHRRVSGTGHDYELGPGDALLKHLAVDRRNDLVIVAPNQQRRRLDTVDALAQSFVSMGIGGYLADKKEG